jgi:hypothetical protein
MYTNPAMLIGTLIFVLISCTPSRPIYNKPAKNNGDYLISYLFEHDGCRVYRFVDGGNCVYFTSCNGETSYQADSITVIRNTTKRKR